MLFTGCGDGQSDSSASSAERHREWAGQWYPSPDYYNSSGMMIGRSVEHEGTEDVTVTCYQEDETLSAWFESTGGDTFTTTRPPSGQGYAGGTLHMSDDRTFTWKTTDPTVAHPKWVNKKQAGDPAHWATDGKITWTDGLEQVTSNPNDEDKGSDTNNSSDYGGVHWVAISLGTVVCAPPRGQ